MDFDFLIKNFISQNKWGIGIITVITPFIAKGLVAFDWISKNQIEAEWFSKTYWYILICLYIVGFVILLSLKYILKLINGYKATPFCNNPASIMIALDCDEDISDIRNKLYRRIEESISNNDLSGIVTCNLITDNDALIRYKTKNDASKLKNETNCSLAIVGKIEKGKSKGDLTYHIPLLHFSWNPSAANFVPDLNMFNPVVLAIKDENTIQDLQIVGKTIYYLSECILALSLSFSDNNDIAEKIWEALYSDLKKNCFNISCKKILSFVIFMMTCLKDAKMSQEYKRNILPHITRDEVNSIVQSHLNEIYLLEQEKIVHSNIIHYKAILLFHMGKIKESVKSLKEIMQKYKKFDHSFSCELSLAFLYMWRKDYTLAVKKYKKICRKEIPYDVASSIIAFNENVIKNNKERIDLLFIIAIMRKFEYSIYKDSDIENFKNLNPMNEENKPLYDFLDSYK